MIRKPIRLGGTSYAVLTLLELLGPSTPYDLKQALEASIANFWPVPHTTFYAEPARLARAGFLSERQEKGGRRRKLYEVTESGRNALDDWLANPSDEFTELRDLGLLQLFFGADPRKVAEVQLRIHGEALARYEALRAGAHGWLEGPRLVLESGIGHEQEWLRFWERVAAGGPGGAV